MKSGHQSSAVLMAVCLCASRAAGHQDSDAFLDLSVRGKILQGTWLASLRDLNHALDLDANEDGRLTADEWSERRPDVAAYFHRHVRLRAPVHDVPVEIVAWDVVGSMDGRCLRLGFVANWPSDARAGSIQYDAFFADDPWHRGHVTLTGNGGKQSAVLRPDAALWDFSVSAAPTLAPMPSTGKRPDPITSWMTLSLGVISLGATWMVGVAAWRRSDRDWR